MPRTTPRQAPFPEAEKEESNGNGYKRPAFVRCDLTTDQKKELAEWANGLTADDLLDYISQSICDGYVLSLKTANEGYQSSLTQTAPAKIGTKNIGKCLVTRASKPERALWSLYYKHLRVMEGDWSRGNEEATLEW